MLVTASSVLGQDIGTTEVKVIEGFKPVIPEAIRLNENATFADTIKKDRTQLYEITDVNLGSDYKTRPLLAAKVKDDKIAKLYGTQIGVGFGSIFTTKANIVHNSKRSKTLSYGFIADHFSNKYSVINSEARNSTNAIHLYAKKVAPSYIFLTNLDYDRRTAVYYDESLSLEQDEFFRNRFAHARFSLSFISKDIPENKLKHHTTFFISDLNEFSENQIHLSSTLSKKIYESLYSLEIEFNDYLRYNNSDAKFDNTDLNIFSFAPQTRFIKYGIDFDLAFDVDIVSDNHQIGFYPRFKAAKELVRDVLLLYAGLDHVEQQYTLKSLSDYNPYIHSFGTNQSILGDNSFIQELKITDTQKLYLGMRNVLSRDAIFEGSVSYGIIRNFAHFIGVEYQNSSRFKITYLDKNVKQLHVNVNYSKQLNDIISFRADADYFNWDVDVISKYFDVFDLCYLDNAGLF